jgi:hypothetical protein
MQTRRDGKPVVLRRASLEPNGESDAERQGDEAQDCGLNLHKQN